MALPDAMRELAKGRACGVRWYNTHPDLGLSIGHRLYLWRESVAAIATGTSLDEAAKIGRQERERYCVDTRARIAGSAGVAAAAA
jgi:hypothetical protein